MGRDTQKLWFAKRRRARLRVTTIWYLVSEAEASEARRLSHQPDSAYFVTRADGLSCNLEVTPCLAGSLVEIRHGDGASL